MQPSNFVDKSENFKNEADVQHYAVSKLKTDFFKFDVHQHKCGISKIDENFPSKKSVKGKGKPDLLLSHPDGGYPICVWENKEPRVNVKIALEESKFYIEGLFKNLPNEPGLPRLAAGFNGLELLIEYYNNDRAWVSLKANGQVLKDSFFKAELIRNGITAKGEFSGHSGWAKENDLREALPSLKNIYRYIPALVSGRKPIDFTIALLTLRMLVERNREWGSWSEQPSLAAGASSSDHAIRERLKLLTDRVLSNQKLKSKYGEIFEFKEKNDGDEISFSFLSTLDSIELGHSNFLTIFSIIDSLPPLEHADFDVFGEVYQQIGDNATKKALGQFFTGRHIISSLLPIMAKRSGIDQSPKMIQEITVCDPACGTGGFLTEFFRLIKNSFNLTKPELSRLSKKAFYGFDLSHSNASRASVNMYFAGDGFSRIEGGYNSLDGRLASEYESFFDFIVTNPPYGKSSYGRAEEAFLKLTIDLLRPGGWGMIVLPTGVLENPRSRGARANLLKHCLVTDSISLPKHTFAPYTQQKTGVLIFQKRQQPLPVDSVDIDALIEELNEEIISFFIVDNDGYANSDKRYPTTLQSSSGEWLHNDLADWVDASGRRQKSLIYRSLILKQQVPGKVSEFGEPLGRKYEFRSFGNCFIPLHHDLSLLADTYLRSSHEEVSFDNYKKRKKILHNYIDGKDNSLKGRFLEEINDLLNVKVFFDSNTHYIESFIGHLFSIEKGTTSFTEEIIYQNYDGAGIPVYGGGAKVSNYKVRSKTKNKKGHKVKVFTAPAIVVSMDGSSGSVTVVRDGTFTANHHAAVLTPYSEDIDLDWVAQSVSVGLKKLASNKEGSATLTMDRLENFSVEVPIPSMKRKEIGDSRRELESIFERFS